LGPLDFDALQGAEGLELALGEGGGIEGVVLPETGGSPAGTIVGLSRGDAHAFTIRCDSDGRFRVDHLAPGYWFVRRNSEEIDSFSGSGVIIYPNGPVGNMPSNCEVKEGQTTQFRLDLQAESASKCMLRGSLVIVGSESGVWHARLSPEHPAPGVEGSEQVTLQKDGSFELRVPHGGRWKLFVRAVEGPWSGTGLATDVTLDDQTTTWKRELSGGTLEIFGDRLSTLGNSIFEAVVRGADGTVAGADLRPLPGVNRVTVMLPRGRCRVVDVSKVETEEQFDRTPSIAEIDIVAGEKRTLELP
jgi:hypothetical protein